MPRPTTGCWTCRARKKKCDDARPACLTCTARSITCYGYDMAKPDWMDAGPREKAMRAAMKLQCKTAYSHRRLAGNNLRSVTGCGGGGTVYRPSLAEPKRVNEQHQEGNPKQSEGVYDYVSHSERDLNMVMYYLDHIFPRLCPFFNYTPNDDGRGWLLGLFLRTKPLCALAVCISACDKAQLVLGAALNETPQPHHDLEMQHIRIATDLRNHLAQLSDDGGAYHMSTAVEALACIMHLVLFELWIPRKHDLENDWTMHLDAASALLHSVAKQDLSSQTPSGFVAAAIGTSIEEHFPVDDLSTTQMAAFRYLLTQYAWYSTSMAATVGLTSRARLLLGRVQAIFHKGQDKLLGMIGCEDWVMTTILDIVVLKEWKDEMRRKGLLSLQELAQRADDIEARLIDGLTALSSRTNPESAMQHQALMVTNIFNHAALVFLRAVKSGFRPSLLGIRHSVLCTLETLEYMKKHSALSLPSWPYCIAGCLSVEALHPRFRALYSEPKLGNHPLVNTKWSLDIMEESWRSRPDQLDDIEVRDWGSIMIEFGTRVLLT